MKSSAYFRSARLSKFLLLLFVAVISGAASQADDFSSTIFFTTTPQTGTAPEQVGTAHLQYTYATNTLSLTGTTILIQNPVPVYQGGDSGIIFNPNNGDLLVGSGGNYYTPGYVYQITTSGAEANPFAYTMTPGVTADAYALIVVPPIGAQAGFPVGSVLAFEKDFGYPNISVFPLSPQFGPGIAYPVTGDDVDVTDVAFASNGTVYYGSGTETSSAGNFGTITFNGSQFVTHRLFGAPVGSDPRGGYVYTGTHRLFVDPLTGYIFAAGGGTLGQYVPSTNSWHLLYIWGTANGFDLCVPVADGQGHVLISACEGQGGDSYNGEGDLILVDYSHAPGYFIDGTGVQYNHTFLAAYLGGVLIDSMPTPPSITQQPQSATVTAPATATFSVAANGGALAFQWYSAPPGQGFSAIPGATQSSYTTGATSAASNGTQFFCAIGNNLGSLNTNVVTLTVNVPAVSVSVMPTSTTLTASQQQQFSATVQNSSNQSVTWSLSPNLGSITGGGLYTAPSSISGTQTVTLTATSVANSSAKATATITLSQTVSAPPSNLVLWWTFDSSTISGSSVSDSSGNGGTGTMFGNPPSVAGEINQALSFNGSNQYIDMSAFADRPTEFNTSMTLAAWIQTSNASRTEAIISKFTGAGAGYIFRTDPAGHLELLIGPQDLNSYPATVTDTATINNGQWHHVAVVINIGSNAQFYVDGQLSSTQAMNTNNSGDGWSDLMVATSSYTPYGTFFTGSIDDLRVYNVALSAGQISAIFSGGGGTSGPPPISVTVSPGSTTLGANQQQSFTASVQNSSNQAVSWTLSPNVGTITAAGLYTAPATISSNQTVTLTATTVATPSAQASATITLTAGPSVSVSPQSITLLQSQQQQFTATVQNSSNQAVTWTLSPNVGSIGSGGLYTAPSIISSTQTVTLTATTVATPSATATATITLSPPSSGPLTVPSQTLPNGIVGVPYLQQLVANGGTAPYRWVFVGGTMPSGLSVSSTGLISGTPTAATGYQVVIYFYVYDSAGSVVTNAQAQVAVTN